MKILILGKTQHGKDEVARIISNITRLKFKSSSEAALEAIWPVLQEVKGYETKQEAFDDRNNGNQMLWRKCISLYNTPDKTALVKTILSDNDIYVGMRCPIEFAESKHLFDHIVYVDASGRVPKSDIDSMGIPYNASAMLLLDNNDTKEQLVCNVAKLCLDYLKIPYDTGRVQAELGNIVLENKTNQCQPKTHKDDYAETIEELIANWANSVFPHRTITNALSKMVMEEIPEYLMAQGDAMELADIGILLYDIAYLAGINLDKAIREKMEINKKRSWTINEETGLMKHVEYEYPEELPLILQPREGVIYNPQPVNTAVDRSKGETFPPEK